MKVKLIFCFLLVFGWNAHAYVVMPRVDAALFINHPQTDFSKIDLNKPELKKAWVKQLFDELVIDHVGTKLYDELATFESYYQTVENNYYLFDLNGDGNPELVYSGMVTSGDESERLQIFTKNNGKTELIFDDLGHLLAYTIHPNTQEILLFQHQYPCCTNASHNINRLRYIEGKFQLIKRYFVARDNSMKGSFFPVKSQFTGKFSYTKEEKTTLYWSNSVILKDAWENRSQTNVIAHYPINTPYTVLARNGKWKYVIMHGAPLEEQNTVINPSNFTSTWIYGWITS